MLPLLLPLQIDEARDDVVTLRLDPTVGRESTWRFQQQLYVDASTDVELRLQLEATTANLEGNEDGHVRQRTTVTPLAIAGTAPSWGRRIPDSQLTSELSQPPIEAWVDTRGIVQKTVKNTGEQGMQAAMMDFARNLRLQFPNDAVGPGSTWVHHTSSPLELPLPMDDAETNLRLTTHADYRFEGWTTLGCALVSSTVEMDGKGTVTVGDRTERMAIVTRAQGQTCLDAANGEPVYGIARSTSFQQLGRHVDQEFAATVTFARVP